MLKFLRKKRLAAVAAGFLALMILCALFAPLIVPFDPNAVDLDRVSRSPNRGHFFGTDEKGRDVFSRVLYGARISLLIGAAATAVSLLIGGAVGLVGGYFSGPLDSFFQMVTDITLAFPGLLLAIGITIVLPPGFFSVLAALSLVGWSSIARVIRGEALSLKQREFVEAGRAGGASHLRVMVRHILPNCLPLILVVASLKVGSFILAESALSFLDLGVRPPSAAWGFMISAGREYLKIAPWMTFFPGLALALTVIACNLLGDAARDYLDPRLEM